MNGKLTKWETLTVVLTTVWITVAVVSTAFLLTTVLSGLLINYPRDLTNVSIMVINHDYHQIQSYLLNPFVGHLVLSSLRISSHGLAHYHQVKSLFIIVEVIAAFSSLMALAEIMSIKKSTKQLWYQLSALRMTFFTIILCVLIFLIDFNTHFIELHHLLFHNGWWVFKPATDETILLMPTSFFIHCCLLWLGLVVITWGILDVIIRHQLFASYFGFNKTNHRWNKRDDDNGEDNQ